MLLSLFVAPATLYLIFISLLYLSQNRLIFPGTKPNHLLYSKLQNNLEKIESDNCTLQGWRVTCLNPEPDTVVIYFGGNAEDTCQMLPILKQLNVNHAYTFNYRGYGLSEGKPSENNLYRDSKVIFNFVKTALPTSRVIIIGHSLGSAVAGYLASVETIDKLVLLSPLSSLEEIAKLHFKRIIPGFLVKHKFDLKTHAYSISAECLVILAQGDSIVKNEFSMKTYQNLIAKKHLLVIPEADHNSLFYINSTIKHINNFILETN